MDEGQVPPEFSDGPPQVPPSARPMPPHAGPPAWAAPAQPVQGAPPPRRRGVAAIILGTLLVLSLVANLVLVVVVFGLIAGTLAGGEETVTEHVIQKGAASNKIAVIRVQGIINEELAERLHRQFERARDDSSVKAVILRIDSPGGGLTASDTIHHDIRTMLAGKPIVAAMDGVAASGGYYIACSAQEIVAQRTTITGSIGVIAQFFFLKGLLQERLGVATVTLKRGEQKDWPNMFNADMTQEQRDYIINTVMEPGYQQFVDIVADSRKSKMDRKKVLTLATGRIFVGKEARDVGLVDDIGYFEDAVDKAMSLAGLTKARVVEYAEPFSLSALFGVQSRTSAAAELTPRKLEELAAPKIMYLWTGS